MLQEPPAGHDVCAYLSLDRMRSKESVWDYPRPPRMEDTARHLWVVFNGIVIADTTSAKRILETSHPPTYYFPPQDVRSQFLVPATGKSWCEWKGSAAYYHIKVGDRESRSAAWFYPSPEPPYDSLKNYVAFYASRVDECFVDGERVRSQAGDFYGGWITSDIAGPFKGEPGTAGW